MILCVEDKLRYMHRNPKRGLVESSAQWGLEQFSLLSSRRSRTGPRQLRLDEDFVSGSGGIGPSLQALVVPAASPKPRRNGAPAVLVDGREIKSLGHRHEKI
jgi:hypothetical protein